MIDRLGGFAAKSCCVVSVAFLEDLGRLGFGEGDSIRQSEAYLVSPSSALGTEMVCLGLS